MVVTMLQTLMYNAHLRTLKASVGYEAESKREGISNDQVLEVSGDELLNQFN